MIKLLRKLLKYQSHQFTKAHGYCSFQRVSLYDIIQDMKEKHLE